MALCTPWHRPRAGPAQLAACVHATIGVIDHHTACGQHIGQGIELDAELPASASPGVGVMKGAARHSDYCQAIGHRNATGLGDRSRGMPESAEPRFTIIGLTLFFWRATMRCGGGKAVERFAEKRTVAGGRSRYLEHEHLAGHKSSSCRSGTDSPGLE